jgi:hypothetical protein
MAPKTSQRKTQKAVTKLSPTNLPKPEAGIKDVLDPALELF